MSWSNPFRRRDANTRSCWGYTFQLTDDHITLEQAHPLKYSYDTLGEECLNRLNEISPPRQKLDGEKEEEATPEQVAKFGSGKGSKRDLFVLLRDHAWSDPKLKELWDQVNDIPSWVDWDQISRGQEVFYRYGGAALTGLAYQSLLGGMGATRVVETLARTGSFSTKVARHRLFETTQHILQCTRSIESIQPGGAGQASSVRVRLLHAAVRQRIMKLAKKRPNYYSVEKWGVPINDLDCIATIGTFSATLIWISFPRQGIWLREQEIKDYVALWRLIAYYTGTPTQYFETPAKAKAVMESLLLYEIDPSETSKTLANNIIRSLEAQPPSYASKEFLEVNARWLNGNELCDRLGLGRPSLYYWALMTGQVRSLFLSNSFTLTDKCIFFMSICYTYRSIPYLDRRKIQALRRIFWVIIVENKHGLGEESVFDFKYVPDYHIRTDKEDAGQSGIERPEIERRNLKALIYAVGAVAIVTYGVSKVVSAIGRRLF